MIDNGTDVAYGRDFSSLKLLGGRLPLNFCNTWHERFPEPHGDLLTHYGDLLAWSVHAGALTADEAAQLARASGSRGDEARRVFRRALALREAIHDIFAAYVADGTPNDADLVALNDALTRANEHLQIAPLDAGGFARVWRGDVLALDRMLWPIAHQAADLLTSDDLDRVRECGGCGWLFLDASKNRSRRWCSMEICGNQAKARRHYQRQRRSTSTG